MGLASGATSCILRVDMTGVPKEESYSATVDFGLVATPAKLTITRDCIHVFVGHLLSGSPSLRTDYDLPRKAIRRIYRRPNILGLTCIWVDYSSGAYEETLYMMPHDPREMVEALQRFGYRVEGF